MNIKWLNWEKASFEGAKRNDKPILLKIGATWCHWCHVMDETTYQDPAVIEHVNRDFTPIEVDNDSRPDINERYNMGGWPTTAFLTPDGELITGATYLPAADFLRVSEEVFKYYRENKDAIGRVIPKAMEIRRDSAEINWNIIDEIVGEVIDAFDPVYAGFGYGQKFPQADLLDLLLLYSVRTEDEASKAALILTLDAMRVGEIRDFDRGGFYRYATMRDWRQPHFEKMLEDNAKLLSIYLDSYLLKGDERYLNTAYSIRDFLLTDLFDDAFLGSVDADSKKVDRRIFTNWNGIAVSSFVKLFEVSGKIKDLDPAIKATDTILDTLYTRGEGMLHTEDEKGIKLLSDQVWFAGGLLDLYRVTGKHRYLESVKDLVEFTLRAFRWDETGLFFDSLVDEDLKFLSDKVWKIGDNSMLAGLLIDLSLITGADGYLSEAEALLKRMSAEYKQHGIFSALFGLAVDKYLRLVHIVIFGEEEEVKRISKDALSIFEPNRTLEILKTSLNPERIADLGLSDKSGVYACRRGSCMIFKGDAIKEDLVKFLKGGEPIGETSST
ncbi:MAG: Thiol:disulfide interchange protein DsbD [Candidatus Syntrophoarchaeum sp. GoM_oil]|nr:MAG: Thiol:disulfide interchange protein DsbD [Candidatus Syntrophoarchaeum sp. GoM_oil]